MKSPVPVVYILGAGHSGSTLLTMLLGSHPEICTIGELKWLQLCDAPTYACSCGAVLAKCEFWLALSKMLRASAHPIDLFGGPSDIRYAPDAYQRFLLRPLHRGPALERLRDIGLRVSPSWRRHSKAVTAFTTKVIHGVCQITNRRVFVDSSKTGLQFRCHLRNQALDVKAIRLVRDARGVSRSYRRADRLSISAAAHAWKRSNEEACAVVSALPRDRWFDLRYEDLCRNVDGTLAKLFTFIGVAPTRLDDVLRHGRQHVLGNDRMRLNSESIRLDEKWRSDLTAADLRAIDRVAGRLNRDFGFQ